MSQCVIKWHKVGEESLFRGLNAANLDSKGRMAIPSRFRPHVENDAEGKVVVTIDTDENCLLLYPLPQWVEIESRIQSLPTFNPTTRRIQRLIIGHATEIELDSSGRVLLPPLLREYAGLQKRVMVVGQGQKIEIWGEENWNARRKEWLDAEPLSADNLPPELQSISL